MAAELTGGADAQIEPGTELSLRTELHRADAEAVMLTPIANQPAAAAVLTGVFGNPAVQSGGVYVWLLGP
ncbi:MAG: hypothetical protein JOZ92_02200 [Candidatus Dormibacteraeota bacterium]|nr:hypothetical protein [Candidatus Dormibacteraeota bacterium]